MEPTSIQQALAGMARTRSMAVAADSHHFIVLSLLNQWIKEVAAPNACGVLLDFGCGGQPYRDLFLPYIGSYVGADVAPAAGVALDIVITPGQPLALPAESVDTILSSQVLEHVPNPHAYLAECRRLLQPPGKLIITVPMQWRHHEEPYDFLRFTRYGLEHLLQSNGFKILDLRPCGGAFALLGQLLCNILSTRGVRSKLLYRLINRSALWLDRRYPDYGDTINWNCIATLQDKEPK